MGRRQFRRYRPMVRRFIGGYTAGAALGLSLALLGLQRLANLQDIFILYGGIGGALAALEWKRGLNVLWAAALTALGAVLLVGYTPLASHLLRSVSRRDAVRPAPVIVVLSSHTQRDGSPNSEAQARILQAMFLIKQGMAPRFLLTNPPMEFGSQVPAFRRQLKLLDINCPILETGPVHDTHDEALETARIAKANGWNEVIVVTNDWHSRRAGAVFEKTGLKVICAPCNEGEYDVNALETPIDRLRAFRDWLHEAVGLEVYRAKGWID